MEWQPVREGFVIRFHHGDDLVTGLLDFARAHDVQGAWVNALGAIEDPELGYYHLDTNTYTRQVFPGERIFDKPGRPRVYRLLKMSDRRSAIPCDQERDADIIMRLTALSLQLLRLPLLGLRQEILR